MKHPIGKSILDHLQPFTQSWQVLLYTAQTKLWLHILKEGFVTWAGGTWQASQHLLGQTPVCTQAALACWQVSQLHLPFLYPNWLCQKYSEAHNTVHILGSGPSRSTCTHIQLFTMNSLTDEQFVENNLETNCILQWPAHSTNVIPLPHKTYVTVYVTP